ncbi:MAG: hypothetical protein WCX17_01200 [Parcubacteria group bacterium]
MPNKTVKVSIKPLKIFFIFLIAVVASGIVYFTKSNLKKSSTTIRNENKIAQEQEIVMPLETGVADSGLENTSTVVSGLNAKVIFDSFEEIDGNSSLKATFLENPSASIKISDYFNNIEPEKFYRLSFLAKTSANKEIGVSLLGDGDTQNLGQLKMPGNKGVRYYEFNFQAQNSAQDLALTSGDNTRADIWLDDFMLESLDVNSPEELQNLKPTIFGDTSWKNTDQSQTEDEKNSEDLLSRAGNKIGQIFQPSQPLISGAAFKIQKVGTGGKGNYQIQLREYDQNLGIISDKILASRNIYDDYPPSIADEIKEKEQNIRENFAKNEDDIRKGRISDDSASDQYPSSFTQEQIDGAKAQKRQEKMEIAIEDMKESYNQPYELEIPIAAKIDTNKKYWIGIDTAGVKVDKNNYIKIFYNSKLTSAEAESSFISDKASTWQEFYTLWFKTFYPVHAQTQGEIILSGASISDFGNGKLLYRYQFNDQDYESISGFPDRRIYDMYSGNFDSSDTYGNYRFSKDNDYAIYKFNTLYPSEKIIIREGSFHQGLAIEFSTDGENWEEVYSENPAENNQKINPIAIYLESKSSSFYLKIRPAGNNCILLDLSLEAELASN